MSERLWGVNAPLHNASYFCGLYFSSPFLASYVEIGELKGLKYLCVLLIKRYLSSLQLSVGLEARKSIGWAHTWWSLIAFCFVSSEFRSVHCACQGCVVQVWMQLPSSWCASAAVQESCWQPCVVPLLLMLQRSLPARDFPWGVSQCACGMDAVTEGQSGTLVLCWIVFPKWWRAEPGKEQAGVY